jgi:hypothetical protein
LLLSCNIVKNHQRKEILQKIVFCPYFQAEEIDTETAGLISLDFLERKGITFGQAQKILRLCEKFHGDENIVDNRQEGQEIQRIQFHDEQIVGEIVQINVPLAAVTHNAPYNRVSFISFTSLSIKSTYIFIHSILVDRFDGPAQTRKGVHDCRETRYGAGHRRDRTQPICENCGERLG